ncbi:hypothetical protein I549_4940 [Mycobacterium avium subsp. avium 2285 (R)]|nr:hypothetical protein I549_4940 [Mycobacterium avium subsp. avium 2285 (R)]
MVVGIEHREGKLARRHGDLLAEGCNSHCVVMTLPLVRNKVYLPVRPYSSLFGRG